jgi:hypothetical protein
MKSLRRLLLRCLIRWLWRVQSRVEAIRWGQEVGRRSSAMGGQVPFGPIDERKLPPDLIALLSQGMQQ